MALRKIILVIAPCLSSTKTECNDECEVELPLAFVRHSRESGNSASLDENWIPAFAGMTRH